MVRNIWLSMRHFLTSEYRDNIYMGQQQYPICNTNIKTNGLIEPLTFCTLYASTLFRSIQTVDYVVKTFSYVKFNIIYLEELIERGLGDFEGQKKEKVWDDPNYFNDKKFVVTKTPPNGESLIKFRTRVEKAVNIILNHFTTSNILVISHLQTLRMIRFCINNSINYDSWHSINYAHGEVVQENYGEK